MSEKKIPKRRNALGRGLGALLDNTSAFDSNALETPIAKVNRMDEIDLDQIEVNPYQPRTDFDPTALQELTDSIKTQGIIQPITVRKLREHLYQLISGERRYQAAKMAGLETIPAYVRAANDQQMLEMALIENIQREDLNSIEVALSYQRLLTECNLKQEELGDRVGKNRATVANYLRLLKLPPDIQIGLRDKKISMGHARAIINIESIDTQLEIYQSILKDDLSVRKVEALVRALVTGTYKKRNKNTDPSAESNFEIRQLQEKLTSHFGTRIQIKANSKNQGDIMIPFASTEDLNRILEILDL